MNIHKMTKHLSRMIGLCIVLLASQAMQGAVLPSGQPILSATQGYLNTAEGPVREFDLVFGERLHRAVDFSFEMGGRRWKARMKPSAQGDSVFHGTFPVGWMETAEPLLVKAACGKEQAEYVFTVPAARKWTVYFLPHSHQDIGYTHRQADVMRLQWKNLEHAIDLAEKTADYPDGARFRWNTEATWAVAGYLREYAGTPRVERLLDAIHKGYIGVDACLGSIITGISRQEELMHFFDDAHRIEKETGIELNTAMMSDVPGQVWGLATAMSLQGIRYYSPAPNYVPLYGRIGNDRAAALHVKWGDHPFWWESQSGTQRVLVWEAGRGYSWFHGWLAGSLSVCGTETIWTYLRELENEEFPYDMCYLRYTIHGDNGPPDDEMPDIIRSWNEKYASPQFRIATTKEVFETFENRYGDAIPTYRGDMTPTWEDGAASSAKETYTNRAAAARLAQGQILWSMLERGAEYPRETVFEGYKNVVLYSEHTWGSSASGPEPDSPFTIDLWNGKKRYCERADSCSRAFWQEAVSPLAGDGNHIQVVNTNLWTRTDVVVIDADLDGKALLDAKGSLIPVQRLYDGTFAFIAKEVPPLSSSVYKVVDQAEDTPFESMVREGTGLSNGRIEMELDPGKGTIRSFRRCGDEFDYADEGGLNDYLYTERIARNPRGSGAVRQIRILEDGPVAATLRVVSDAPGCDSLIRDVTLWRGLDKLGIRNTLDKQDIRTFENVRFVFPFHFPHPDISMDLAMSEVHPEREQLSGVNKHYYSLQNGLAVGDLEHRICLTSIDAPFVEFGTPSGEDYRLNPRHGYGWWSMAQISPRVYSWVMTNTWRTNYKASQGGRATFRYTLQAVSPFLPALKKRGLEEEQPLVAFCSPSSLPVEPLFTLRGHHEIAVSTIFPSEDGSGWTVRLQNLWNRPVCTGFQWGRIQGTEVFRTAWRRKDVPIDPDRFWLQPYEYVELTIKTKPQITNSLNINY